MYLKQKHKKPAWGYVIRYNKSAKIIVKSHTKTAIMTYTIAELADFNPALAAGLKNRCYAIIGLCQQMHREMGPFLNEYMYQDALDISLEENGIKKVREYYVLTSRHYLCFFLEVLPAKGCSVASVKGCYARINRT